MSYPFRSTPHHSPTVARVAPAALVALTASVLQLAPAPVHAQAPRSYTYTFRVSPDRGESSTGTVRVLGDRARIDMTRRRDAEPSGDYLLVSDSGRTVTVVNPREREYSVTDAASFEQIVATVMRALDLAMIDVRLSDARVSTARLGPGDTIAGHPTERYRLTQEYSARVGALGFQGTPEYHVVMTDYWVSPSLRLMRNPLIEMLSTTETALAQQDSTFVRRAAAARDQLFIGTPLRIIVVAGTVDEDSHATRKASPPSASSASGASSSAKAPKPKRSTTTIEVTDLKAGGVDPALLDVPSGYREREGRLSWRFPL